MSDIVYFDQKSGQWRINPRIQLGWYNGSSPSTPAAAPSDRMARIASLNAQAAQLSSRKRRVTRDVNDLVQTAEDDKPFTERQKELLKVYGLEKQLAGQEKQAEEGGGHLPGWLSKIKMLTPAAALASDNPQVKAQVENADSLTSRALDVISRPAYSSMGFLRGVSDPGDNDNPTDVVAQAKSFPGRLLEGWKHGVKGAEGKEKWSGSKVLSETTGLHGKPAAAVGFGLDVVGDPSSYTSLHSAPAVAKYLASPGGTVAEKAIFDVGQDVLAKGGSKLAAERAMQGFIKSNKSIAPEAAGKDIEKWLRKEGTGVTPTSRKKIIADRRNQYRLEQKVLGQPVDPDTLREVGIRAADDAMEKTVQTGEDMIKDEIATRLAIQRGNRIELRFGDAPILKSEKLGALTGNAGKFLRQTPVGRAAESVFRTNADTGEVFHTIRTQFVNTEFKHYSERIQDIKTKFAGTTRAERAKLYDKVAEGTKKGLDPKLSGLYDEVKTTLKKIYDDEVQAGVLNPKTQPFDQNYVYQVYKNSYWQRGKSLIGTPLSSSQYGGVKKWANALDAKSGGAPLIDDVADMLAHRIAKSHREIAEHNFMKYVGDTFGMQIKGKGTANTALKKMVDDNIIEHGEGIHSAVDKGVYFDKDTARALRATREIFNNDKTLAQLEHLYDKVQGMWKFGVLATPGAQFRNLFGDIFVNMLDGVTNPRRYEMALGFIRGEGLDKAIKVGDDLVDGHEFMRLYDAMGLRTGFLRGETNVVPHTAFGRSVKISDKWKDLSERREDFTRIAHFMDSMVKEAPYKGSLDDIAERAAKRVKKYNFDYNDLTRTERNAFRRIVPFYTYMRKATPMLMETFITRPGRMAVIPKANQALNQLIGAKNEDVYPGGVDGVVPEWIREVPSLRLLGGGADRDALFLQPDLPTNQLQDMFGGFGKGNGGVQSALSEGSKGFAYDMADRVSPFLKFPLEYASGQDIPSGVDNDRDVPQMLLKKLPLTTIGNSLGTGAASKDSRIPVGGYQGPLTSERLISMLTGVGLRQTTPDRMSSELRRQQDVVEDMLSAQKKKKEKEREKRFKK